MAKILIIQNHTQCIHCAYFTFNCLHENGNNIKCIDSPFPKDCPLKDYEDITDLMEFIDEIYPEIYDDMDRYYTEKEQE